MIDQVVDSVATYLEDHQTDRAIFVDDGSTDQTADLVAHLIKDHSRILLIRQQPNQGKGAAIHRGATACNSEYICFVDGDLAYSLDHLDTIRKELRSSDVVIGSRQLADKPQANITVLRRFMGNSFNWYVRVMLRIPFRDTQAGIKGFQRQVAEDLFGRQRLTRFAFDAELLYLARASGYSISEILATVSDQHSYRDSTVKLIRDPIKMFWSVLRVRFNALAGRYGSTHPTQLRR